MITGKWAQPRQALLEGKVIFFPRTSRERVYSIFSFDRRKGVRITAQTTEYQDCPGTMVWRVE